MGPSVFRGPALGGARKWASLRWYTACSASEIMWGMLKGLSTMAAVAFAAAGCSGAPLGGGSGGSTGAGGKVPPCTTYTGCGTGAGGITGSGGGAGGGDGALCAQSNAAYSSALTAALACTPGAPNQCQAIVATYPTVCPGSDCSNLQYVNDGTTVEAVRGEWLAACEPGVYIECIAIACDPPAPPISCVPTSPGATTGTCVPYGSDAGAAVVPDGGESCDQLVADYAAAVTAALACTPGAPNQCQAVVSPRPDACNTGCGAGEYVNDATGVNTARQRWIAQCVGTVGCPLILCPPVLPPSGLSCVPNVDAGALTSTGTCAVTAPD
jgi:hypothetical protein